MNLKRMSWKILIPASVALVLAACEEKHPMQKAGKAIDRAAEKTGDKLREIGK